MKTTCIPIRSANGTVTVIRKKTVTTYTVPPAPSEVIPDDIRGVLLKLHEIDAAHLMDVTEQLAPRRAIFIQQVKSRKAMAAVIRRAQAQRKGK